MSYAENGSSTDQDSAFKPMTDSAQVGNARKGLNHELGEKPVVAVEAGTMYYRGGTVSIRAKETIYRRP